MRDEVLFARVLVSLITILCFVSVLLYYEGGNKETREYLKKRLNSNLVHYLLYLELLIMYIFGGVSLAIFTYTDWLENYCNISISNDDQAFGLALWFFISLLIGTAGLIYTSPRAEKNRIRREQEYMHNCKLFPRDPGC